MSIDNPYASPQSVEEATFAEASATNERGLMWALFSIRGRVPRRTFWAMSIAASAIFYAIALLLDSIPVLNIESIMEIIVVAIVIPSYVLFLWVSVAIQVKRWHDLNRSGWWYFVSFIPAVGPLVTFVMIGCLRGTIGPNRFGEDRTGDRLSREYVSQQLECGKVSDAFVVELDGTEVSDGDLADLARNARIEELRLGGTNITDAGLVHIQNLTTLRLLDLSVTQITDAGLASLLGLSRLTTLWLGGTRVTDAGLLRLVALPALSEIHLANTDVTTEGADRFRQLRPDCVVYP